MGTVDPQFGLTGAVIFDEGVTGTVWAQFWGTVGNLVRQFTGTAGRNSLGNYGAGDRNRTGDPVITSDVLYQLSYPSSAADAGQAPAAVGSRAARSPEVAGKMVRPPRIELGTP